MALATPDAVVLELMTMGQQSAAYLGDLLQAASPASQHQEIAAEILRCCGRVIAALRAGRGKKRKAVQHEDVAAVAAAACSPPKKRSRGAEALRVVTSGTTVDGFIWRKYGQKEINGRRHPRLYYRCAYRDHGCTATRRVQRAHEDEEAPAYEIAYYGEHTCGGAAAAAACQGTAAPRPPGVIDFGSNAWPSVGAAAPASEHQLFSWDGEMSSQGGWSSSASSEAGFEGQTTHEWHNTPCYAPDPVTEFLDGSFDWASVINEPFDFGSLHHIAALQ